MDAYVSDAVPVDDASVARLHRILAAIPSEPGAAQQQTHAEEASRLVTAALKWARKQARPVGTALSLPRSAVASPGVAQALRLVVAALECAQKSRHASLTTAVLCPCFKHEEVDTLQPRRRQALSGTVHRLNCTELPSSHKLPPRASTLQASRQCLSGQQCVPGRACDGGGAARLAGGIPVGGAGAGGPGAGVCALGARLQRGGLCGGAGGGLAAG